MVNAHLVEGDGAQSIHGQVNVYVEKASAALEPPLDLKTFSGQSTPLGVVADLLDDLGGDVPEDLNEVLSELEKEMARWNESQCFGMNADGLPDATAIRRIAREQVLKIAHLMHDQLEGGS